MRNKNGLQKFISQNGIQPDRQIDILQKRDQKRQYAVHHGASQDFSNRSHCTKFVNHGSIQNMDVQTRFGVACSASAVRLFQ